MSHTKIKPTSLQQHIIDKLNEGWQLKREFHNGGHEYYYIVRRDGYREPVGLTTVKSMVLKDMVLAKHNGRQFELAPEYEVPRGITITEGSGFKVWGQHSVVRDISNTSLDHYASVKRAVEQILNIGFNEPTFGCGLSEFIGSENTPEVRAAITRRTSDLVKNAIGDSFGEGLDVKLDARFSEERPDFIEVTPNNLQTLILLAGYDIPPPASQLAGLNHWYGRQHVYYEKDSVFKYQLIERHVVR